MGMAASQARFLGLTARKTNVEYEGQQVNQQRTTLGNQTSAYYNQLLGMKVPTPPSVDQFTKTSYSFSSEAGVANTITNIGKGTNPDTYTVDYTYLQSKPGAEKKPNQSKMVSRTSTTTGTPPVTTHSYMIAGKKLTAPTNKPNESLLTASFPNDKFMELASEDKDGNITYQYFSVKELESVNYDEENKAGVAVYGTSQSVATLQKGKYDNAQLEFDAAGRLQSIQIGDDKRPVETNTVKDEAAYEDAMNGYEFQKAEYQKTMDDVNGKIEIVQQQDKNLELRLKNLDTEQEAIQTEMDAVQKVIQKNTESTFKTFA